MAQTTNSDSALSGGLLVVLGIIVAVVIAYFVWNNMGSHSRTTNLTIEAPSTPTPSAPSTPSAPTTNP